MSINNILRILVIFIAVSGCFSVLFSAWLSHGASAYTHEDKIGLATALAIQFIHTLALLALVVWLRHTPSRLLTVISSGFALGILLFCGAIYIKILCGAVLIGKLAPIGGMLLALSWLLLAFKGKSVL